MLTFSTELPPDPRGQSLELIRCPVARPLAAIVTSENLIGCRTHFYGGRTVPCTGEDCDAHKDGVPWRWHTYASIWRPVAKRHLLFESTARASEPFILYRKAHGSLRGCLFSAQRANSRVNSRVNINTKPADLEDVQLPESPDLLKVLSIIWNIPLNDMQLEGISKSVPLCQVDQTTHLFAQRDPSKGNGQRENDPAIPA